MADLKDIKMDGISIFDIFYPVGTIYETSNEDFDPNNVFNGTWERVKGKVLVGVDENDSTFASSKLTGGEKTHTLTVDEMPSHAHAINGGIVNSSATITSQVGNYPLQLAEDRKSNWSACMATLSSSGGGGSHNNLQPYYTVYIWERTA